MATIIGHRTVTSPIEKPNQYLVFSVDELVYAVDIFKVQEIKSYEALPIHPMNEKIPHLLGLMKINDDVLPLVDISQKNLDNIDLSKERGIVVVLQHHEVKLALRVTSVRDILELNASQIKPALAYESLKTLAHVTGVGVLDEHFVMIFDVDQLFELINANTTALNLTFSSE